ncbi:MAG TPA: radical SAM protein, partial [Anaerolineales bacterium]|nr:radical SAM protein [Anaerolineales bacterium]
ITHLLEHTDLPRLRVSSLEPWDLDAAFFELWQDPRLCRHLHLPLQSGSATVLRRMARKTTPQAFTELVKAARQHIPGVAITTDVIAGFPGESEAEFEETRNFVKEMAFAGMHVFTYSARQGTAAARMPDQVHNFTRKERSAELRQISSDLAAAYRQKFIGTALPVLWETSAPTNRDGIWEMTGLTDNYLKVKAEAGRSLKNHVSETILKENIGNQDYIRGEIIV